MQIRRKNPPGLAPTDSATSCAASKSASCCRVSGVLVIVTKPNGEPAYYVTLSDGGLDSEIKNCSCPFSDNGLNQHTCKHCKFVMDGVKAEMEADEARADAFTGWATHGKYDQIAGKF